VRPLKRAGEFVKQPRLAEPRVADDRQDAQLTVFAHRLQRFEQPFEFGVAPDHARLDALDAARAHAEGARPRALDRVSATLRFVVLRSLKLPQVEDAADVQVRVVRDEDGSRGRGCL
jgi:hypothetical protein